PSLTFRRSPSSRFEPTRVERYRTEGGQAGRARAMRAGSNRGGRRLSFREGGSSTLYAERRPQARRANPGMHCRVIQQSLTTMTFSSTWHDARKLELVRDLHA